MELSVIMPVYNAGQYLAEAIESVINQTYTDFEFIIINDGSTDNSLEIIEEYSDVRIILIDQQNKGLAATLNVGLSVATGKYIARMDADDICLPRRFEKQLKYLHRNKKVKLLGTAIETIDANGNTISYDIPYVGNRLLKYYLFNIGNPFKHPTIVAEKSLIVRNGGYNETINKYFEDYFLWSKIARQADVAILPDILLKYRITPGSIMSSIKDRPFSTFMLGIINKGTFDDDDYLKMLNHKAASSIEINLDSSYETRINSSRALRMNKLIRTLTKILPLSLVIKILLPVRYIQVMKHRVFR